MSAPPLWKRMTREERGLQIAWATWAAVAFFGAPIALLIYWLAT